MQYVIAILGGLFVAFVIHVDSSNINQDRLACEKKGGEYLEVGGQLRCVNPDFLIK